MPSADSISGIACSALSKRTAAMPSSRAASQFTSRSSTNTQSLGRHAAEPLERERVDRGVGLAQADESGVHDQLEQLVDLRQLRAPERLPLAHVVREQRRAHAAAAQLADEVDHRRGSARSRSKKSARRRARSKPLSRCRWIRARNSALRDLAALEHEQRVVAVLLGARAHRRAELLERDARLLLVGEEAGLERRREHAAEVADQHVSSRGGGWLHAQHQLVGADALAPVEAPAEDRDVHLERRRGRATSRRSRGPSRDAGSPRPGSHSSSPALRWRPPPS